MEQGITIALALGSNLGQREKLLKKAIDLLQKRVGKTLALSSFYETAPLGFSSQNPFLNGAILMDTTLSPLELLETTQEIERILGRTHKHKQGENYTDRLIDIDILLYGDKIIEQSPTLLIPHSQMHLRPFVLEPLVSIYPLGVHPLFHKTLQQLYQELLSSL